MDTLNRPVRHHVGGGGGGGVALRHLWRLHVEQGAVTLPAVAGEEHHVITWAAACMRRHAYVHINAVGFTTNV